MIITYLTGKDDKGEELNRLIIDTEIISDDKKICKLIFYLVSKLRNPRGHGGNIVLCRMDNVKNTTTEIEI